MSQARRPRGHENVATALVDPAVMRDLELDLMAHDLRVWPVSAVSSFPDPQRLAFQVRRALIDWSQGLWADAGDWTPVWITFGESWLDPRDPEEPIGWPAHAVLWERLGSYGSAVRFNRGLGGVPRMRVPRDAATHD